MAKIAAYMEAIFSDLANEADMASSLSRLRTADIPTGRKKEQYKKLATLRELPGRAVRLANSRFVARYMCGAVTYLCVHVDGISKESLDIIESTLEDYRAQLDLLDESTFLFLAFRLKGMYRVKDEHLSSDAARDIIQIVNDADYNGHQIDDMVNYFEQVRIFSIKEDSILINCSDWLIASILALKIKDYRSMDIKIDFIKNIDDLFLLNNINPENLYYALTSIHWKQRFMELYKCLESLFYLPWVVRLKSDHGFTQDGLSIAKTLKVAVRWRQAEKDSIQELFSMADVKDDNGNSLVKDAALKNLPSFKDINFEDPKTSAAVFGRRIYKIRCILVHQEDYEDATDIEITENCWPVIVKYVSVIIHHLYSSHKIDSNYSYDLMP